MVPLVAAAWLVPPGFPMLPRQALLGAWGVGATLAAERWLFGGDWRRCWRAVGFVPARPAAVVAAALASLPMWLFLPLWGWFGGVPVRLRPDWLPLLVGVVLVNGVAEEVLHRGFVFAHLHRERSFARAAVFSSLLFAAQHLYLVFIVGWVPGLASVLLAALLAFPFAHVFARGGGSLAGPALLHTSSNAPMIVLALPADATAGVLVPYMGVVLVSIYLVFVFVRGNPSEPPPAPP